MADCHSTIELALRPSNTEGAEPQADHKSEDSSTSDINTLREDVSKLIAPWRDSVRKPPFTIGEMAVFALVLSDEGRLSTDDIHTSILRAFSYYNKLAIEEFVRARTSVQVGFSNSLKEVIQGFPDKLDDSELPVGFEFKKNCHGIASYTLREYRLFPRAARIFLRKWLEPPRVGSFPFLDLAPELRNRIYELVLRFPDSGMNLIKRVGGRRQLQVAREVHCQDACTDVHLSAPGSVERLVRCRRLSKILALLCTCKKISQKASSVFYAVNTFRFDGLKDMYFGLLRMSPRAMGQIRSVHIVLSSQFALHEDLQDVGHYLHHFSPRRLKFTIKPRLWLSQYNNDRLNALKYSRRSKPVSSFRRASGFSEVAELQPFIDLTRRAERVEFLEIWDTGFKDFMLAQVPDLEEIRVTKDKPQGHTSGDTFSVAEKTRV